MKISYNWLKKFIAFEESAEAIGKILTATGLEVEVVEKIESVKGGLDGIVVGEVLTCEPFTVKRDAAQEKQLSLTTVAIGTAEPTQIVCGAANVRAGQKVIVATVGATIYPTDGEPFSIGKRKVYGHTSEGMICAEDEIGLGQSHEGILVLDTDLPNGTPAAKYFNLEADYCIEIGLTPNRADAASHLGVARDLKAALQMNDVKYLMSDVNTLQKPKTKNFPIALRVEEPEACPRFCGVTIDGITVKPSPDWLQQSLKTIGLNPINNVVDITNYICHGLGQPMHAYDWHAIEGQQIIVKYADAGAKFTTLDKVERTLTATDLMVCNGTEPMGIGGVFGGTKSGIKDETTRIYLECAYFDPATIRKTAMRHGLKTDASFRFERGTDPNAKLGALNYCAQLVLEIAGGEIASDITDFYPNPIPNFEVSVKYKNVDRLIGKVLDRGLMKRILNSLDIDLSDETTDGFVASVPPYRVDVTREADVIEEILRIYGFDNIELSEHLAAESLSGFPKVDADKQKLRIATTLAANGFNEVMNNSLTKPAYSQAITNGLIGEDVKILNALSEDLSVMRQTMLFSGLESLSHNLNRRQRDLKVCEFGKTYHKIEGKYVEKTHLMLMMVGNERSESWLASDKKLAFHNLAEQVNKVLATMRVVNVEKQEIKDNAIFDFGLCYSINKKPLVTFGQVRGKLTKMLDIKQPVFYADFDWAYLLKQYSDRVKFKEVPRFPEVRRDLSLVLDKTVPFEQIKQVAYKYEKALLTNINVFDVYEGEKMEAGKKSYSVNLTLQDTEQTLTDKVIDKTMQKLMLGFEKELGAVIRK
jgi:phenylalanyl-tRNA synthetase beta chain